MNFDQLAFIKKLYPLHRTLVSDDSDLALDIIRQHIPDPYKPDFDIVKIPSGTKCWTWSAPAKYTVKDAYLEQEDGRRIADFKKNCLHIASYSQPVNKWVSYDELVDHLYYCEHRPDAIPWKFFYYVDNWAFCISYNEFKRLDKNKRYKAVIDSTFENDFLKIGELCIKGAGQSELLIITNYCHPCQANDSISGVSAVVDFLHSISCSHLNLSLRILFLPETIGSICYFSHKEHVVPNIRFGIFTEMLGNDNSLALQLSFKADTYIDRIASFAFHKNLKNYRIGKFREIVGNDELVTNGPWLDIPTISISRSKITLDSYPEYHTSDDTPDILIENNLKQGRQILWEIFLILNNDYIPIRKFKGPIFLSGYGLWGVWGDLAYGKEYVDKIMYLMEGKLSVFDISEKIKIDFNTTKMIIDRFVAKGLVDVRPI